MGLAHAIKAHDSHVLHQTVIYFVDKILVKWTLSNGQWIYVNFTLLNTFMCCMSSEGRTQFT